MNQSNVNTSMSRLNPKASAFSSTTGASSGNQKMNANQYGSSFMGQNNNNFMKSPGSNSYQRSSVNSQAPSQSRWFQESYGNYGGQGMEFSGSSPSMSPNNNSQQSANQIDDSRKAPAPIGNERSYNKYYSGAGYSGQNLLDMDTSAMMNNSSMAPGRNNSWMDKNQQSWQMSSNPVSRGPYDAEFPMQDIFQVSRIDGRLN
jgi:hypothetical protein